MLSIWNLGIPLYLKISVLHFRFQVFPIDVSYKWMWLSSCNWSNKDTEKSTKYSTSTSVTSDTKEIRAMYFYRQFSTQSFVAISVHVVAVGDSITDIIWELMSNNIQELEYRH